MTCPDLDIYAADCVKSALEQYETLDDNALEALDQDASDNVWEQAESACIYYSSCRAIIERYDSQYGKDVEDTGEEFKASEWEQARSMYATALAAVVIRDKLSDLVSELRAAYEAISDALPDGITCNITTGTNPYGWAAHDNETSEGLMVWHDLEGELEARAIECGDLCLFASWSKTQQPQTVEA